MLSQMKKRLFLAGISSLVFALSAIAQTSVQHLLTENRTNPLGIDQTTPRFSWQLAGTQRNIVQSAYEIKVTAGKNTAWSSGKVISGASVQVPYAGNALQSGTKYDWQVRVWDNNGKATAWSDKAVFQMALLAVSDWKAQWISPGFTEDSARRPAILFRKTFPVGKKIVSAIAYITAHGMYEGQINGQRIGDAYL